MRAEQKAFILCVALALWYSYRRQNVNDYVNEIEEEQTPECKDKLEVSMSDNYGIAYAKRKNIIDLRYGRVLAWNCKGNVDKLNMKMNGKILDTYIRGNLIFSSDLRLLEQTELICMDTESKCMVTVIVKLIPIIAVVSRNEPDKVPKVLQYVGVTCMGPESSRLSLRKDGMRLDTDRYKNNKVADIQTVSEPPELRVIEYVCTDENTGLSDKVNIRVTPIMHSPGYLIEPDFEGDQGFRLPIGDLIDALGTSPRAVNNLEFGNGKDLISEPVGLVTEGESLKKITTDESTFVPIQYHPKAEKKRVDEL